MKPKMSDWWWINGGQSKYVCPLLHTLSMYVWRMRGKSVHWYGEPGKTFSHGVYMDGGKSRWEMPNVFPKSWILAECRFRNWQQKRLCSKRVSSANR
jgi:hypothetical protein